MIPAIDSLLRGSIRSALGPGRLRVCAAPFVGAALALVGNAMWTFLTRVGRSALGSHDLLRALIKTGLSLAVAVPSLAGCVSMKPGPNRPISIEEDVANIRPIAEPDLTSFAHLPLLDQAYQRNQIVTARMYIADLEYHKYEALLTKEMQSEGLAATLVSLGLTGSASVITVASTDRILSAVATVVTGADKAYNEKELLSNTIQALQTQMRADRKAEAAEIFVKMLQNGVPTPIGQYPLAVALSDVDHYYQAGTVASALVGLSKTVANAEHHADIAKAQAGPNPVKVTNVKDIARPPAPTTSDIVRSQIITNPDVQLHRMGSGPVVVNEERLTQFEQHLSIPDIQRLQGALCVTIDGHLGMLDSPTRIAISNYLKSVGQPPTQTIAARTWVLLERRIRRPPPCNPG